MELGFTSLASLTTACRRHEHPFADAAGVNATSFRYGGKLRAEKRVIFFGRSVEIH
jgi:hypothetical protein